MDDRTYQRLSQNPIWAAQRAYFAAQAKRISFEFTIYQGAFSPAFVGSLKMAMPPTSRPSFPKLKARAGAKGRARSLAN